MLKKTNILVLVIVMLLILGACNSNLKEKDVIGNIIEPTQTQKVILTASSSTKTTSSVSPTPTKKREDINQYIFYHRSYNVQEGLYRYNLDGTGELLWQRGIYGGLGTLMTGYIILIAIPIVKYTRWIRTE